METKNCEECGVLVYETDIIKKSGLCWRCEIKRLKSVEHAEKSMRATNHLLLAEIDSLKKDKESLEHQLSSRSKTLYLTVARMKLVILYCDRPEVKEAIAAWLEPDEDGGLDWLNPPPAVDEALEKIERYKESLDMSFPE